MSKKLMPSVRRTNVNIFFDPTQSSTKEIGFEIRAGVASKTAGRAGAKYHMVKAKNGLGSVGGGSTDCEKWEICGKLTELLEKLSPYELAEKELGGSAKHPRREQKLKGMLEAAPADSEVTGVHVQATAIIKGVRPRTWTSTLTVVAGTAPESQGSIKQIWDIQLERSSGTPEAPKHICVKGKLNLPILPIWNTQQLQVKPIEVQLYNKISMGVNSCTEASILTSGQAKVSEEQKTFSRQSAEAKQCGGKKFGKGCKLANLQARTLDTIEITNTFTKVPQFVKTLEQKLTTIAKIYLWPFTTKVQGKTAPVSSDSFTTHLNMQFQKWARGVDMTISRPQEELVFSNVRIPYPLSLFVPVKAGSNNFRLSGEKLFPYRPTRLCYIRNDKITKFSGKTMDLKDFDDLEKCYHVLTAGLVSLPGFCSAPPAHFSVSAKRIKDQNTPRYVVKMKTTATRCISDLQSEVIRTVITVELPVNGQPKATIEQAINGKDVPTKKITFTNNKTVEQVNNLGRTTIIKVPFDNAIFIQNNVIGDLEFNGRELFVGMVQSLFEDRRLTGLCGDGFSMKGKELKGTKTCTYTKPILEVASQRVQTGSCPQLEGPVKAELEKEKAKCEAASFHEVFGQGLGNGMAFKYGEEHFNSGIAGGMGKGSGSGRGGYGMGGVSGSGGNGMGGDYGIGSKRPCFDDLHDCEFQEQLNGCPNLLKQGHCAKHCGLCHNW